VRAAVLGLAACSLAVVAVVAWAEVSLRRAIRDDLIAFWKARGWVRA
jgi:hypothetical protein